MMISVLAVSLDADKTAHVEGALKPHVFWRCMEGEEKSAVRVATQVLLLAEMASEGSPSLDNFM